MSQTNDNSIETRLLDDSDFVKLMEIEFSKTKLSIDELEKRKIWNKLEEKINRTRQRRYRHWISIGATALVVLSLLPVFFGTTNFDSTRIKGASEIYSPKLSVYALSDSGELLMTTGQNKVGESLVFKVSADHGGALALGLVKNNGELKIHFMTDSFHAGGRRLLQRDENTYAYMIEPLDQTLRFCVAMADNEADLKNALASHFQDATITEGCVSVSVSNPLK